MTPVLTALEPERQNKLLKWWSEPEGATLLECLEKARQHALVQAADLHIRSKADADNQNFIVAANEKMIEAATYETTIKTLKAFLPDGPFIQRIEL